MLSSRPGPGNPFGSRLRLAAAVGVMAAGAALAVPAATATAATGAAAASRVTAGPAALSPAASSPAAVSPAALTGFACRSLTFCVAVGANAPQMASQLIAERWNGGRWSRSAMPKPAGTRDVAPGDVACPSTRRCVAVGAGYPRTGTGFFAIAEYWNGSRWTAARAADPGAYSLLSSVSCPSATSCYAVGQYGPKSSSAGAPLIEHWNGRKWSVQTAPVPRGTRGGLLNGVSCPAPAFCVAAGTDGPGELIERWNGSRWSASVPRSSSSATLSAVSCPSAVSCFAVGSDGTFRGGSLAERWNGRTWTGSTTPVPPGSSFAGLQSVSCVSATRCLAVGNDLNPGVYADAWNGRGWHAVRMTTTGGHLGELSEVHCLAATSCVALAQTTPISATARSESAFWNGTRWKVIATA